MIIEDKIVNLSVREANDELLEKQIYAKIDFDSFFDNIDNIKKMNNSVICFLGAGVMDKIYLEYLRIKGSD